MTVRGWGVARPGGWQVVKEGLEEGEWVVVKGFGDIRPGMAVKPQRAASPSNGKP